MNSRLQRVALAAAAIIGVAAGIYAGIARLAPDSTNAATDALYAVSLPDLDLRPQALSQWKEQTLLVNFWATWCVPCREEIPALVRIQSRYSPKSMRIVGIALDNPDQARAFAKDLGINYPVLIGSLNTMDLTRSLGNRGGVLPYTLALGPGGKVSKFHLGALKEPEIEALIAEIQAEASGSQR
jgi:thiol-disulfide isomerase/thioredoxin